ncbi:MAG: hypothetical protein MK095_09800, partial [Phycisphaerales bacterium]|nr:hypothetical protein [Phycisphaerales bacterium]
MKFSADRSLATLLVLAFVSVSIGLGVPAYAQDEDPAPEQPSGSAEESETTTEDEAGTEDADASTETTDASTGEVDAATQLQAKVEAGLLAAQRLSAEARWRQCADKYAEVLKLQPDNEKAKSGYQKAMNMLNEGSMLPTGSGVGMASVEQQLKEQRQRSTVEFQEAYQNTQELIDQEDYAGADRAILTAQIKLRQRRQYLSESEYGRMNSRAEAMIAKISSLRVNSRLLEEQALRQEAESNRVQSEQKSRDERNRIIRENLKRVRQLQQELKYREALQVIDEILFVDPNNPSALALRDAFTTTELYRDFSQLEAKRNIGFAHQDLGIMEAQVIPHRNVGGPGDQSLSGMMAYPDDWPQITYRRGVDGGYNPPAADKKVIATLDRTMVPIDFNNYTFEVVESYFEDISGLEIYIDWKALELMDVTRESTIQLQLAEVPMDIALDRTLEQFDDGSGEYPRWAVHDGMLQISTKENLEKQVYRHIVVYDVRDI